ncbi:restriction endonuclease subunit S [Brevibacillus reuszeri]|uniref:restriction endonuclease subunit S n=1 Tax=Brevibacillus reuszeri TaxID=54915 RepID=UPI00289794AA|nr:restriction endonuclease subunit S [Brevibacillus reuszeri]
MTEHKQKLVPAIRFNAFTDTWEQRKLGDIMIFSNGINASKESYGKGRKMISVMDILAKESLTYERIRNSVSVDKKIEDKNKVENGDLVFVRSSEVSEEVGWAKAYLQDEYALYSGFSIRGKRKRDYDAYFIEHSLNYVNRKQIESKAGGSTRFNVSQEILNSVIVLEPSLDEQVKISSFFKQLDDTITLHQRKLDGLVTLKDGFLQQMFPAANEVMPRVRFAGFTGNWEERRLGEMLTERNEQFEESEDYPLMSFVGNVGVVPKGEQYDRSFLVKGDDKKYKKTELNDFIYSSNNLETGSIGLNRTGKAVISPVYSIFYSSNDSESLFVGLLSKRKDFINKMIHYRQGVMYGQWRIHERDFLKIIVLTPTISEQNRIIDFFKNFDEQIAAQTAKLEQLRQLKAAYLQRMFI